MAGRAWRYGLLGVGAVAVVAAGSAAVWLSRFDPNSLKPRIAAAVLQATGRDLALHGPISLKWSLWPTVALQNVAFANPPGFAQPQMATLDRLEVQLAVLPLLRNRVEIARLVLVHPDILLEVNAQGQANWQLHPAPVSPPASGAAPGGSATGGGATATTGSATTGTAPPGGATSGNGQPEISLHDVQIEGGTLTWRDDRTGKTLTLALAQLTATSASPDSPLTVTGNATYNDVAFKLGGEVGPLARLQQPDAETPWPVKLTLAAAGATLSVNGTLTHPLQGRGYSLTLDTTIPDLVALAPLLPGVQLPPLHDVHVTSQIADSGGPIPLVQAASLHLGAADLGSYVGGLQLASVDIEAPKQNQPVHIAAQGSLAGTPLKLAATVGAADTLLAPAQPAVPIPLDLTVQAADASLTAKGTVAHPETLSGADLTIGATIPDLSALSPLAHRPLPAVTQIAFQGHLVDAAGGFRQGATIQDMKLTTADGDLSGTIGVTAGPPRSLTGTLHADQIDADALLAALGRPVPQQGQQGAVPAANAPPPAGGTAPPAAGSAQPSAPSSGAPQAVAPQGAAPQAAVTQAAIPPPSSPHPGAKPLDLDTPIPFDMLRQANADLSVTVGDLKTGGSDYRSIDAHLVLQDGKLTLSPASAQLPEGALSGSLTVDATAATPPIALTLHAPGLEVAPLLAAARVPGYASGKLEVYADLHSAGDTPHAIAAGLDGSLGLAMQNGTIDTQLLDRWLGGLLQKANLPDLLSHGGSSDLRCFALRADLRQGVATLRALDLNSSALSMDGSGSVNLGEETLALQLRPQGRLGGTVIVVPMRVTGPIRSPGVVVNGFGTAAANAGTVAGAVVGSATPLGLLGGLLGGGALLDRSSPEACAGPLALARGQPVPAAATSNGQAQPKPSGAGALLHDLLH